MKRNGKIIFHIDLNAFFASVHIIEEPFLKNKVFAVGGSGVMQSGVISSASYKARALGIRSAMNVSDALNIYPKLLVVPTNHALYSKYSNVFFKYLRKYSDNILKGSIDEAYIDMTKYLTDNDMLAYDAAKLILKELNEDYNLPVSIGISTSLYLAKMASDMKKPLGITVIGRGNLEEKLYDLPVSKIHGVGKKTEELLHSIEIYTIRDVVNINNKSKLLTVMSENHYTDLFDNLTGQGSNYVPHYTYRNVKSISNEETLAQSVTEIDNILLIAKNLFETTHARFLKEDRLAKTVNIKLKFSDFKQITRSYSFKNPTKDWFLLWNQIELLFYTHYNDEEVRLVGVGLSNFIKESEELNFNLFTYQELSKKK